MGTPEFAVTCLQSMISDPHYEIVGVLSQPDRPAGRKLTLTASPVKKFALQNNLQILTPESLKKQPEVIEQIATWKADIGVVVAFGQILQESFMNSFPLGCVNVHASLLPKWRGAAPIQRAIQNGDVETGVCLQKMVKKLDAGDVFGYRKFTLDQKINSLELHDQLAKLACELLHVELMDYARGNLVPMPQNEELVTYAHKIEKSESAILWKELGALQIHNKIRAFAWGPGAYCFDRGERLKMIKSQIVDLTSKSAQPGEIVEVRDNSILIQARVGVLEIVELQPESRARMSASDYLKSRKLQKGELFT
jgi:methionyl-tRNA formyltransferase